MSDTATIDDFDAVWGRAAQIRLLRETFVKTVTVAEAVGSTNDWAQERLKATPQEHFADYLPALYVAARQTAGRGRGSNRWWNGPHSLAFTLVFDPAEFGLDLRSGPPLSLSAGLAVVDAVRELGVREPLGLHWPNDIFVGQRKLAGILTEVTAGGVVILGIGLNGNCSAAEAPEELRERLTTLLDATGAPVDLVGVLSAILVRLAARLREWREAPANSARSFQETCLQIGCPLTVEQPTGAVSGLCLGIAPDGALLLQTEQGPRRIISGALRHAAD